MTLRREEDAAERSPDPAMDNERGSVLVIAMLMLIVFSVLGATLMTLSNTEGQIATNQTAARSANRA